MASAREIQAVANQMPGVPRHVIEQQIDAGNINPDNYDDEE